MNKGESPTVKRSQRKSDRDADMPGQQPSVAYSIGNKKPPPAERTDDRGAAKVGMNFRSNYIIHERQ